LGVVYRARDLRLDRKVAIKLLPAELTQNPDSVRRFIPDAKAASALNQSWCATTASSKCWTSAWQD
jgi:serine/threonine protein kinase